jgi:hypothetical protein
VYSSIPIPGRALHANPKHAMRRNRGAGARMRDMQRAYIRWLLFLGLAAFLPLVYYLAVVGGLLPYGAMLIMAIRNLSDASFLWFSFIHLSIYGVALYWLAGLVARLLVRRAGERAWIATAGVLLLLAGIGLMPIFGIAHGQIRWTSAYDLYSSGKLR